MKVKARKVNGNKKIEEIKIEEKVTEKAPEEKKTEEKAIEKEPKENKTEEKDEYSILNYFKDKKNIASVLTILSALAAGTLFITKVFGIIAFKRTMNFWNFNSLYTTQSNTNFFTNSLINIIFMLIVTALEWILLSMHNVYRPINKIRIIRKFSKHYLKKHKKQKILDYENGKSADKTNYYDERFIKELKGDTKSAIKYVRVILHIYDFYVYAILGIIAYIYVSMISLNIWINVLIVTVYMIVQVILTNINLVYSIKDIHDLKESIFKEEFLQYYVDSLKKVELLNSKSFKLILKDSELKYATILVVLMCLYMGVIFTSMPVNTELTMHYITTVNNTEYIIIYQDGNQYCLEEVERDGEKLTVFTNRQCIVNSDDMAYKVYKFDEIIREGMDEDLKDSGFYIDYFKELFVKK